MQKKAKKIKKKKIFSCRLKKYLKNAKKKITSIYTYTYIRYNNLYYKPNPV